VGEHLLRIFSVYESFLEYLWFANAPALDRTTDAEYQDMGLPYLMAILMLFISVASFFMWGGAE
jgi:hypothetical protein